MTDQHPITPPPDLVRQWMEAAGEYLPDEWYYEMNIATQAARWGADQELDACCEFLEARHASFVSRDLHAARRPKPKSLAEEALEAVTAIKNMADDYKQFDQDVDIIHRALERLKGFENGEQHE